MKFLIYNICDIFRKLGFNRILWGKIIDFIINGYILKTVKDNYMGFLELYID